MSHGISVQQNLQESAFLHFQTLSTNFFVINYTFTRTYSAVTKLQTSQLGTSIETVFSNKTLYPSVTICMHPKSNPKIKEGLNLPDLATELLDQVEYSYEGKDGQVHITHVLSTRACMLIRRTELKNEIAVKGLRTVSSKRLPFRTEWVLFMAGWTGISHVPEAYAHLAFTKDGDVLYCVTLDPRDETLAGEDEKVKSIERRRSINILLRQFPHRLA